MKINHDIISFSVTSLQLRHQNYFVSSLISKEADFKRECNINANNISTQDSYCFLTNHPKYWLKSYHISRPTHWTPQNPTKDWICKYRLETQYRLNWKQQKNNLPVIPNQMNHLQMALTCTNQAELLLIKPEKELTRLVIICWNGVSAKLHLMTVGKIQTVSYNDYIHHGTIFLQRLFEIANRKAQNWIFRFSDKLRWQLPKILINITSKSFPFSTLTEHLECAPLTSAVLATVEYNMPFITVVRSNLSSQCLHITAC